MAKIGHEHLVRFRDQQRADEIDRAAGLAAHSDVCTHAAGVRRARVIGSHLDYERQVLRRDATERILQRREVALTIRQYGLCELCSFARG